MGRGIGTDRLNSATPAAFAHMGKRGNGEQVMLAAPKGSRPRVTSNNGRDSACAAGRCDFCDATFLIGT